MKLKIIVAFCLFPICLPAQTVTSAPSPSGPPVYVLYRLFFRDVAALDAAAAQADAAGQPGGNDLRGWYQSILVLTPAEIATLKQSAAQCNQALDQHQQTAQPVIAAVQAAIAAGNPPASPPPQLATLDQERAAISNTCIQNLQTAIGNQKFTDIDVFVKTKFAQKVSAVPPAGAPFANTPVQAPGAGK